ncbi:MAG: metallophosphoesterase [Halobaculum sp.]
MELAVVSDLHGNRVALDAVREDMPTVDRVVCAGDVVGYNPWPAACVAWAREEAVPTVMGNHDRAVASGTGFRFNSMAAAGVEYARDALDEAALDWLADLPDRRTVDGRVRIVHGHPDDVDHYTYPAEFGPELLAAADGPALLVMGHTHVQHHEQYDEGTVLNPGSVGQPRDGDPRAAYAVVDLDASPPAVEERRVAYDVDRVVEAVEAADLPRAIGERLRKGK